MDAVQSQTYVPRLPLSSYAKCMWWRRGAIPLRRRELSMLTGSVDLVIDLLADRIKVYESPADSVGIVCTGSIVHGAQSRVFVFDDLRHAHIAAAHGYFDQAHSHTIPAI